MSDLSELSLAEEHLPIASPKHLCTPAIVRPSSKDRKETAETGWNTNFAMCFEEMGGMIFELPPPPGHGEGGMGYGHSREGAVGEGCPVREGALGYCCPARDGTGVEGGMGFGAMREAAAGDVLEGGEPPFRFLESGAGFQREEGRANGAASVGSKEKREKPQIFANSLVCKKVVETKEKPKARGDIDEAVDRSLNGRIEEDQTSSFELNRPKRLGLDLGPRGARARERSRSLIIGNVERRSKNYMRKELKKYVRKIKKSWGCPENSCSNIFKKLSRKNSAMEDQSETGFELVVEKDFSKKAI